MKTSHFQLRSLVTHFKYEVTSYIRMTHQTMTLARSSRGSEHKTLYHKYNLLLLWHFPREAAVWTSVPEVIYSNEVSHTVCFILPAQVYNMHTYWRLKVPLSKRVFSSQTRHPDTCRASKNNSTECVYNKLNRVVWA